MPKKQKLPRPVKLHPLGRTNINGHRMHSLGTEYPGGFFGYRIFNRGKLFKEEGGKYDGGQGSAFYKVPYLVLRQLTRYALADETIETALEQACEYHNTIFGWWSVRSRVFILEDGQIAYEITTIPPHADNEKAEPVVTRGSATCQNLPENWTRIAIAASKAWREAVEELLNY